jgi:hypothetical protein
MKEIIKLLDKIIELEISIKSQKKVKFSKAKWLSLNNRFNQKVIKLIQIQKSFIYRLNLRSIQ